MEPFARGYADDFRFGPRPGHFSGERRAPSEARNESSRRPPGRIAALVERYVTCRSLGVFFWFKARSANPGRFAAAILTSSESRR